MTDEHKQKMAAARKAAKESKEEGPAKASGIEKRLEEFASSTEEKIESLTNTVDKLTELIKGVIDTTDHRPAASQASDIPPSLRRNAQDDEEEDRGYFPKKFRRIIDEHLGPDFEATLEESSGADCILKIIVPKQWDCRIGDEKLGGTHDIRTGLVKKASDIADVDTWCKKFAAHIKKSHPSFRPPKSI